MKEKIFGSECCKAATQPIKETIVKTSPGVTSYFRNVCTKCGNMCHTKQIIIHDKNGVEVKPGDMLHQVIGSYGDTSFHYHICYDDGGSYGTEIRDLGGNNVYMCEPESECVNLGHITRCYKSLPDNVWQVTDWEYYFYTPAHKNMENSYTMYADFDLEEVLKIQALNNFPENWELPEEDKA